MEGDDLSTSPIPWHPNELSTPQNLQIHWEGPVQVDPCKGRKEQLHHPGDASSSFSPLGGERNRSQRHLSGLEEAAHTQHKLGKGNVGREGMEEVMGASRTHQERVRKTVTGSRGGGLGYGEGSSLHPAQKK